MPREFRLVGADEDEYAKRMLLQQFQVFRLHVFEIDEHVFGAGRLAALCRLLLLARYLACLLAFLCHWLSIEFNNFATIREMAVD
jgi:hypothetical protein